MAEIVNYYSQHYRALPRLLRNAIQYSIFEYLLDEHLALLKKGISSPSVYASNSSIAANAGVNRGVVAENLRQLEEVGLIIRQGSNFYLCTDYLVSVISLLNSQKTILKKDEVVNAFKNKDKKTLLALGLEMTNNGDSQLKELKGTVLFRSNQTCSNLIKPAQIQADLPTFNQNCSDVDSSAYIQTVLPTSNQDCSDLIKPAQISTNLLTFDQYCLSIISIYPTREDFLAAFGDILPVEIKLKDLLRVTNLIYEDDPSLSAETKVSICNQFWVSICRQTCSDLSNRNKYIEINKEIKYENEQSSFSNIGGEKEIEEDFRDEEEIKEISERRRQNKILSDQKNLIKRKSVLIKFTEDQVEEIISDINNCLDAPEKIFINIFWEFLREEFFEYYNNEEELPDDYDISLGALPSAHVERTLKDAYRETLRVIQEKRRSPDDDELPIPDFVFSEDDMFLVVDWQPYQDYKSDDELYHISKSNFNSLQDTLEDFSDKPIVHTRRTRSDEDRKEREDDFMYVQKINKLGIDDDSFDKLTPVEAFIFYFCQDYLELDDNLQVSGIKRNQLGWKGSDNVKKELFNQRLELQTFENICFQNIPRNLAETELRTRMFSADKIRKENKRLQFESVVDETNL